MTRTGRLMMGWLYLLLAIVLYRGARRRSVFL